ncbi:hypothetical protein RYX36_023214, partial [Vicia faba]
MIEESDTLAGLEVGLIVYVGFGFYSLIEPVVPVYGKFIATATGNIPKQIHVLPAEVVCNLKDHLALMMELLEKMPTK